MSGNLGLSSPWARQALPDPLRSELRALVPDGWTVGLSVAKDHRWYRAWANDDATGRYALHIVENTDPEAAIRRCIAWIEREYPPVVVRVSYLRCARCGHKLDSWGDCDPCTADERERDRTWTDA